MIIISPKKLEANQISYFDRSECPILLTSNVQGVNHIQSLTKISKNMYLRFPYIRAAYQPIFKRVKKDILDIGDCELKGYDKRTMPQIEEDPISIKILFGSIPQSETSKVSSILMSILSEEALLDSTDLEKISWEDRTQHDYSQIEKEIQKRRLSALERIVLRESRISKEDINRELRDFFNPFTLSSLERNPILRTQYD